MPSAPPRTSGAARTEDRRTAARAAVRRSSLPARTNNLYGRRFKVGRIALILTLAASTVQLVSIQTVRAENLSAAADRQTIRPVRLPAERGAILDRAGVPLAFSVEARALVANPRDIARKKGVAAPDYVANMATTVAAATGQDPGTLLGLLNSDRGYVVLARIVDPETARRLRERFPDIAEEYREDRQYPAGPLAANVVGSAVWNADTERLAGRVGLESSKDNQLAGSPGQRVVDMARESNAVIPGSLRFERPAVPGATVALTLDSDLQYVVQRALSDTITASGAKPTSSVVVLDSATSEVLALATGQTFDPREPGAAEPEQLSNPAVSSPFEPGSVNKVVTMAAALEDGVAGPEDVLAVPGSIKVADRTVSDAWNHGVERYTLTGVLAKSSNVGTIMTARKVGEERFAEMLARFGIGEETGVGLPGESAGFVPPRETWSGSTFGNLPIGQGLSMTTLQMAGMYQAVANDGLRIPPRIIASTTGPDGVLVPTPAPAAVQVVSPGTAAQLRTMLSAVTQDARGQRGTGYQAAVPGYQVAGKTGTAQQVDPGCKCYSSTYWITFAGIFPAQDPRFVIAIMLDAPGGGTSAAPLFHDIATYLAQRERLPVTLDPPPVQTLVAP